MGEDQAAELAQLMQEAALFPSRWQPALDAVNAFVGGNGVALLSVEARQKYAPMSSDMPEMMDDYFGGGWYRADRREACVPLLRRQGIVFDHDVLSLDEIEAGDYYHDFLLRHRRKWFAGVGADVDGDTWCLALQRAPDRDPFGRADLGRLAIVRGHLIDNAYLSTHLGLSWIRGLRDAVDMSERAAIVFDKNAAVLHMNEAAGAIVGDYLTSERTLRFDSPDAQRAFDLMLKAALALRDGPVSGRSDATVRSRSATLSCHATCLFNNARLLANNAAAVVFIDTVRPNQKALLRATYGLTEAEADVAIGLASGQSVKEISGEKRAKEATVRAQLKSVYQKTSINKQSKLVAFIRNLA